MTLDEAADILNIKRNAFAEESELQKMLKVRLPVSLLFPRVASGSAPQGRVATRLRLSHADHCPPQYLACLHPLHPSISRLTPPLLTPCTHPTSPLLEQNFDHLFKVNAPLNAEGKPHSSHYLQSKIVRAKERIEAEIGKGPQAAEAAAAEGAAAEAAPKDPPAP